MEINYTLMPTPNYGQLTVAANPDILTMQANNREIIKITPQGEIYWHGRLVETDDDFKASMLELAEHFKRKYW